MQNSKCKIEVADELRPFFFVLQRDGGVGAIKRVSELSAKSSVTPLPLPTLHIDRPFRRAYPKSRKSGKRLSGRKAVEEKKRKSDKSSVKMRFVRQRFFCTKSRKSSMYALAVGKAECRTEKITVDLKVYFW